MRSLLVSFVAACGFSQPPLHSTDGGTDSPPDAADTCPSGGCQLLAIEPTIANTGDTITLEGTFAAHATVVFPGNASVEATVLGAHRATVVVPAAATAGDLAVTSGGMTVGPVSFTRATFQLGLQAFEMFDDQTNGARPMPSLVTGRNAADHSVVVARGFVYVAGGANNGTPLASVERARIGADGSLGAFELLATALTRPRQGPAVVATSDFIYVMGGDAAGTVERAAIHADGSLGAFAAAGTLTTARSGLTANVIGNSIYAMGNDAAGAVDRAAIAADGSLGAFAQAGTLVVPRTNAYSVVIGPFLYVIGGAETAAQHSVEAARIQPDGSLGAFAEVGVLAQATFSAPTFAVGNTLYVVGGPSGASIQSARINADGTLGTFAVIPGVSLPIGQGGGSCIAGGFAYVIDGSDATAGSTTRVQRASLNASSGLGPFASAPAVALATARAGHASAIVGDSLYVLGGGTSAARIGSIEQAHIAADATMQPFTTSSVALPTAEQAMGSAVVGSSIYLIGGNPQGFFTNAVSRTVVSSGGTLQAFTAAPALGVARSNPGVAIAGTSLYVFGGHNSSGVLGSVERATINADGSLSAFATVSGVTLSVPRFDPCVVIARNSLYAIGGSDGTSSLASIERAAIANDGTIGTFSIVSGASLAGARAGHACKVIGNSLYVFGGSTASGEIATIERAQIADDGSLGAFSTVPGVTLVTPVVDYASVVSGGFIYTIGGFSSGNSIADAAQATLQ